jgi:hypothetical protein
MLLETLNANFPTTDDSTQVSPGAWRLRQSYLVATRTLAGAGTAMQSDGMDAYVAARADWEPLVGRVARVLGYTMPEIDRRS